MTAERPSIDRRDIRSRARRFVEVGMIVAAMFASHQAEAGTGDSRSEDNAWAQLRGENTEERARAAERLERECETLQRRIDALQERVDDEDSARYARDPGLRFQEKGKLKDAQRELRQKQAAIRRLQEGAERGAPRAAERRGNWSEAVEGTLLEFTDPTLDLSATHLGNQDIAAYYSKYKIGWQDHRLYMDAQDGTPDGSRVALTVGPELVDADFYFQDRGRDLLIVFTDTAGAHKTLKLDDGYYGGFYDSDAHGRPVPVEPEP